MRFDFLTRPRIGGTANERAIGGKGQRPTTRERFARSQQAQLSIGTRQLRAQIANGSAGSAVQPRIKTKETLTGSGVPSSGTVALKSSASVGQAVASTVNPRAGC